MGRRMLPLAAVAAAVLAPSAATAQDGRLEALRPIEVMSEIVAGGCSHAVFQSVEEAGVFAAESGFDREVTGFTGEPPFAPGLRSLVLADATSPAMLAPADHLCIAAALEFGTAGLPVAWESEATGAHHVMVPGITYTLEERLCRVYHLTSRMDGRRRGHQAVACREAATAWMRAG